MSRQYLGSGGRLEGGPADELIAAGYRYEAAAGPRLADGLSTSDLAHVVALTAAEAIPADQAKALLTALLDLDEIPGDEFPFDPALGDAFNSREHQLKERAGKEAAGWLSAGRPRREAFRVGLRLVARDAARDLHDACIDLASALTRLADRHATDLAADYTYLQPAQPTRLGHLILAYAYPVLRDATVERGPQGAVETIGIVYHEIVEKEDRLRAFAAQGQQRVFERVELVALDLDETHATVGKSGSAGPHGCRLAGTR